MKPFADRIDAGRQLALAVVPRGFSAPVVLALPRGGVPVAFEVAKALGAPLDLVMVRKIGVPSQLELAVGAVVNGAQPEIVINDDIAAHFGITADEVHKLAEAQLAEIRRRRALYLPDRAAVPLKDRTAIVVDDGIATGATMRAALRAVRRQGPKWVVLAVPVAARDSLTDLEHEADEVICLMTPDPFIAVGAWYSDFPQVSDDAVVRYLHDADRDGPAKASPTPGGHA
jgi:putative phosphoribosyl transferase